MKPKKPGNKLPTVKLSPALYSETPTLHYITPTRPHSDALPVIPDDVSLAHHMGMSLQAIWGMVHTNKLEDHGKDPNRYNKIVIQKDDGSKRFLHEPEPPLKAAQRILLGKIFNQLECPDHFGAYVPGRSHVHMAKRHVDYKYKLSLDLKDFFHWVHRNEIRDWLMDLGYPRTVRDIIATLTTVPIYKESVGYPLYVLPQGGPTSGMIANWVAHREVDQPIMDILETFCGEGTCGEDTFVYSRYSDNIEISFSPLAKPGTMSLEDFRDFLVSTIKKKIAVNNFWLNDDKTRMRKKGRDSMRILNIVVNEKLNIPSEARKELRAMAHNAMCNGLEAEARKAGMQDGRAFYDMLQSKLAYWAQVRPEKVEPWQEKLQKAWDEYN